MNWPRAHWIAGAVALVLFLSAGAYMRYVLHVPQLADGPRMVYRSRFLFLLLAAVANFGWTYAQPRNPLQRAASVIVLLAPLPLVVSFFIDADRGVQSSPATVWTMRALLAAAVLTGIANRPWRKGA